MGGGAAALAVLLAGGGLPGPAAGFVSFRRRSGGGSDEYEPVRPPGPVQLANFSDPAVPWDAAAAGWETVPGRRWSSSRVSRDPRTRNGRRRAAASDALRATAPRDPTSAGEAGVAAGRRVGNSTGLLCNLPMRFEGRWYDDCAPWNGGEWCLTVDKGWDLCNPESLSPAEVHPAPLSRVVEPAPVRVEPEAQGAGAGAAPAEEEPCEDRWKGYQGARDAVYGCTEWALEGGCQVEALSKQDCARTCGYCGPEGSRRRADQARVTVGSLLDNTASNIGVEIGPDGTVSDLLDVPLPADVGQGASSRLEPPAVGSGGSGRACAPPVMIFDFDGVLKFGASSPGVAAQEITERFLDMGFHIAVSTGSDFADYKQEFVQEKVSRRAFPDELWRSGAFVKNTRAKDFAIRSIMEFFGQRCDECVILFDDNDYRWAARQSNTHLVRVGGGRGLRPVHFAQAMQYLESKCLAPN